MRLKRSTTDVKNASKDEQSKPIKLALPSETSAVSQSGEQTAKPAMPSQASEAVAAALASATGANTGDDDSSSSSSDDDSLFSDPDSSDDDSSSVVSSASDDPLDVAIANLAPKFLMFIVTGPDRYPYIKLVPRDHTWFPDRFDNLYGIVKNVQAMDTVSFGYGRTLVHGDWTAAVTMLLWQDPNRTFQQDPLWLHRTRQDLHSTLSVEQNWVVRDKLCTKSNDSDIGQIPPNCGCWVVRVHLCEKK